MGGWFLNNTWPNVPHEAKETIAAYLKDSRGSRGARFIISEGNYKYYVNEGKRLLKLATSPQVSP
jgi:hypothetical protein